MDCKSAIKEYCASLGIELVGFTRAMIFDELQPYFEKKKSNQNEFEEQNINIRINPFYYMEDGKTIISIAFPYFHGNFKGEYYFSKYTMAMDYHKVLAIYLKKICNFIENLGGKCVYMIDSTALPERYLAALSGIGFIGKNNMLITEKYGSYIFLGEIITDLIIEEDKPINKSCGPCNLCIEACPTSSLADDNPNNCLSYITQKKDIEDKYFPLLKGRIFGCDSCQDLCPWNHNAVISPFEEFKPYDFMVKPDIQELVNLRNSEFNEKYKKTSAAWRGKVILQRNALINLFYNISEDDPRLIGLKFTSPTLQHIYNRLLKIFKL